MVEVGNSGGTPILRRITQFGYVSVLFCSSALYGQVNHAQLERRIHPMRTSETITVDGQMEEPAWSQAPVATDFVQNEPRPDDPASEKTEVRVLYDSDSIYFGVYAYDSQARSIIISDLRKDFDSDKGDSFEVVLDTFHDRRNGYRFATNAAGAKWDAQMVNEGRETNANWDAIWNVKTRVVEDGWVAEIAIPFRTLKFRREDVQSWGINFQRRIRRRNETSYWSPLPRIYDLNRVSLAGTLNDLEGIKPGANFRIKPYAATSFSRPRGSRNLLPGEKDTIPFCRWASGGTCYNADFGVDVKYALTPGLSWDFTYNTDFSQVEADEQQINLTRFSLFFPEKREFFLENSGIFAFGSSAERGVRASDMVLFFSRRIGLSDDGGAIPILGGTRLTGRLGGTYELGFLNIQQKEFGSTQGTNFTVARLRRNVMANSDIGVMFANKEVMHSSHYNRVLGADANLRFGQRISVNSYLAKAFTPTGSGGTLASRVGFEYRDTRLDFRSAYIGNQENFINEMGFVPRIGIHKYAGYLGWAFRPRSMRDWLRSTTPHVHYDHWFNQQGATETRNTSFHIPLVFQDSSTFNIVYRDILERITETFPLSRSRNIFIPPGAYNLSEYNLSGQSDSSRRLSGGADWTIGHFYTGYKHTYGVNGTIRFGYRLETTISLTHNNINLPEGHYKTNLVTARVNYSFSTNMFLNALIQYNSDTNQVSSNIRFNLIHRPLSDFFVVYNERRTSLSNDLVDRALILKFTYMIVR